MAGGTVRTIPSRGDSNSDAFQSLCLHLLWRTLRCPGIDRDTFFLTGPSLLSRGTLSMVRDTGGEKRWAARPGTLKDATDKYTDELKKQLDQTFLSRPLMLKARPRWPD